MGARNQSFMVLANLSCLRTPEYVILIFFTAMRSVALVVFAWVNCPMVRNLREKACSKKASQMENFVFRQKKWSVRVGITQHYHAEFQGNLFAQMGQLEAILQIAS